jgi:hypothetical protein
LSPARSSIRCAGVAIGGGIIPMQHDRRADLPAFLLADLAKKGDGITTIASVLRERAIERLDRRAPSGLAMTATG